MAPRKTTAKKESESTVEIVNGPAQAMRLFGHAEAINRFTDSARSDRLHHAWLLTGPNGIGKATFAYAATRWLLSGRPDDFHVAPNAPGVRMILTHSHPQLLIIDAPAGERIGVDEVRRLQPFLRLSAADGGWRIVMIDAAERLTLQAQNALLKLLEEPPPHTLLWLIAGSSGQLLPTIRSRTTHVPMKALPDEDVMAWLASEAPELDLAQRKQVLTLAEGSPGFAQHILRHDGLVLQTWIDTFFKKLPAFNWPEILTQCQNLGAKGQEESRALFTQLLLRKISDAATGRAALPLNKPAELWEKIRDASVLGDASHLDDKVVLSTFFQHIAQHTKKAA